jgi:Ca2+-binding RTX toxin-like protein
MATQRIDIDHEGYTGLAMGNVRQCRNGRFILFQSSGDGAIGVPAGPLFIRDMLKGVTEIAIKTPDGQPLKFASDAFISDDGRYIVFETYQTLSAGDDQTWDLYRYDRRTGEMLIVSRDANGAQLPDRADVQAISPDGNIIVFSSYGDDVAPLLGTVTVLPGDHWSGSNNLYRMNVKTGEVVRLTQSLVDKDGEPILLETPLEVRDVANDGEVSFAVQRDVLTRDGEWVTQYKFRNAHNSANPRALDLSRDGKEYVEYFDSDSSFIQAKLADGRSASLADVGNRAFGVHQLRMADDGRFVVFASDWDPVAQKVDAGLFVWDTHKSAKLSRSVVARVVDLPDDESVQNVEISADGRWITYSMTGGGVRHYRSDNPLRGDHVPETPDDATISGTNDEDLLFGTSGDDVIRAKDGQDEVRGAGGNDRIYGEGDGDSLYGDSGDDTIHGDGGSIMSVDYISGGTGADTIHGDSGDASRGHRDTIEGGAGDDKIWGNGGGDHLVGGDGHDEIHGQDGDDTLIGEDGDDKLYGEAEDDRLTGGDGDDELRGGTGDDRFWMDKGDDLIDGGLEHLGDGGPDGEVGDELTFDGSAQDYVIRDEFVQVDGETVGQTVVTGEETGTDTIRNVEEARFYTQRTNAVEPLNKYVHLANAANEAYQDIAVRFDGWIPLSSIELGIKMQGYITDNNTSWTFATGVYTAKGPGVATGHEVEAVGHVYIGQVDGKTTLMVGIRGTDSASDTQDYPQFQMHYERMMPFIDAVIDYVKEDGRTHYGKIDQVWVAGHSLGGATVQQMMQDHRIFLDGRFSAATFGSPGSEESMWDDRIVHFEHSADIVPFAGDMARGAGTASGWLFEKLAPETGGILSEFLANTPNPTMFRTAGDVVRIGTPGAVGSHPLAQHSMTNYVQSILEMAKHPASFPFLALGTAGVPGDGGHADVVVGTDGADVLKGSWAWVAQALRGGDYFDGAERFVGGVGADVLTGGSGLDRFEGTLEHLKGDVVTDLAGGERIRVWGAALGRSDVTYLYDKDADAGSLLIGGTRVHLDGAHSGVWAVEKGEGYTDVIYHGPLKLAGAGGADDLAGGEGRDDLRGGGGGDRLSGGAGEDRLVGDGLGAGSGTTRLSAESAAGDDFLDGGLGADRMTGGGGRDLFVVGADAADTITDFQAGVGGDVLDLSTVVTALGVPAHADPFA